MRALFVVLLFAAIPAKAETCIQVQQFYVNQARETQAGFAPSPARGEKFFHAKHAGGKEADRCSACHTENPKDAGETRAHKRIEPLAPVANPERFTDAKKVEKWFRRNCNDVLGRACTPEEKADFIAFLNSLK